ncbi:MAG TPA: TrkA family potassium uptake protein [Kofleriaceae bacterium]|nr:TrkA family potassium uptake protein [Kofleriaceae bacterium]
MSKQVLIIGLGQFGMSLVRALAPLDVEVIAVDKSKDRVRAVTDLAASTSCIDATDETALATLAPARRDVCICAIGDESRESSIICTALLRQLGARRVLARATDPLHERILGLIGAHEVVNPESIVGQRVAMRLAYDGVRDELTLAGDLVVTDVTAPAALVGHTLKSLGLPQKYEMTVAAIRRGEEILNPRGDTLLREGDSLVLVSRTGRVQLFLEKLS